MEQANVESEIRGRHFQLPFEFNDKDRLGPWEILLSESTINDLREMLYNEDFKDMQLELPLTIEMVMKKLRQLSSGAWKKYGLQHEASSYDVPVYKVEFPDNNLKILWQIDYGFSIHKYLYMQHVKVWTITSSQEKFDTTLKALKRVHKIYTSEYIRRCSILRMSKDHVVLPEYFENKGTRFTNNELDNDRLLEVHKMFVTNKFIPISKDLFRSLIQSGSDFAFLVSKTEYEIISDPTSAIVYGRSGTGKTTCIVFRQLVSYLKSQLYKTPSSRGNDEYLYKRQIFITLNPILCLRVKKYFSQLQKSAELGGEKLTKARFLKWKKDNDSNKELDDDKMHEEDDEKKILGEIPNSFRLLTDHHFPLFVTFNKFSEMLQGTYGIDTRMLTTKQVQRHDADNDNAYDEGEFRFRTPFASMSNASWAHFVDYNLFEKKYWPHFSDYYRKKLDCELVYSEFSIIKGTNIEVNYLSREEYRSMSTRKHPAFCHNRDEVYDLFERYEMMKSRNYDFDSVDRTLAILRATKTRTFGGPHIHEVYIDECQDNQIIDYDLILKLFDRADSIFMAGDVAQCIARGSTFRFRDLYALIYQWNLKRDLTENIHYNPIKPKEFELNTNYRSHRGILELASSVIHLLWKFFPDSIDKFSPELSEVGGPQPLIIEDCQAENLFAYRNDVEKEDANIEFGASQVIIVRNETAKQRVKDINSNIGLVLTVFEAKGMEFNDVLLYNFFTDSAALLKWRVILSDLDDHSEGNREFSPEKHYILSSELKHLYVAITRAREHLWIFDEDAKLSESMRTYWVHKKLVKTTNEMDIFTLTKKSSPSEWNFEGKAFFEQRKYEQAIFCFKRSRNEKAENLARAYHLQQIARTSFVSGFDEKIVRSNFKSAAEAFEECSRLPQAASCYENIGMYRKAGDFYSESQMFEPAARCYLEVKMWNVAGGYFEKAKLYDDAALAYKDGNLNDMITDLIQRHRQDINVETIKQLNLHFRQEAGNLQSHNKLEEAADMLNRSVDDNDIINGSKHLLRLCRDIVLKEIIIGFASSSTLQELRRLHSKASKTISKVKTHERYNSLDDESQSYISYFNKDLDIYDMVTELIKRHRQDINGETIRQLNIHFRQEADNLLSQNKFEEAADMLNRSVDIDENTINASQYLLCLCRAIVLKETITGFTSSSSLQELRRLQSKAAKAISKVKIQTKRSKSLMEESQLYISYINKDLNKVYECGQFFMKNEELVTEFFAVIMWLQFPSPSDINIKYWDERLQCLLRLCKLAFPYLAPQKNDKIAKISKVFEDIFFCFESKINNLRKRKISFYNPLYHLMDIKHKNNEANTNSWKVYDLDVVHQKISQFLISYIYDLISKVGQDGRDNLDIASIICYDFASSGNCHSSNCQMYHVTPTPLLLYQRLKLARLQYTVVRQLDVLYRQGLLKEKSQEYLASQNWWAENLIKCHMRYQSPHTSCPEVIYMALSNLPNHIRDGLINEAYKTWLFEESRNADNFEVMLKCMFYIQQLQDKSVIDEFCQEMSKTKILSHPNDLPDGFEYYCGNYQAIQVGRHLSLFFSFLYSNKVIPAIISSMTFINHAIKNIEFNLVSTEALGDLTSLLEFTTSLIFTVGQKYCDLCLPRAYLINYFEAFTSKSLIPGRNTYSRKNYLSAINNSIDQVQQLLDLLFCNEQVYLTIILRLIRLLILIGLNESSFAQEILKRFKNIHSKNKIFSTKIKKYLEENEFVRLVEILYNDLKEIRCDSLVIVHHQSKSKSKFAYFEKNGVKSLTYNSIEEFRSSLRKIISSATGIPDDQLAFLDSLVKS